MAGAYRSGKGREGTALVVLLVFMTIFLIIFASMLGWVGIGLRSAIIHGERVKALYLVQAGAEHALLLLEKGERNIDLSGELDGGHYIVKTVKPMSSNLCLIQVQGIVPERRRGRIKKQVEVEVKMVQGRPTVVGWYE